MLRQVLGRAVDGSEMRWPSSFLPALTLGCESGTVKEWTENDSRPLGCKELRASAGACLEPRGISLRLLTSPFTSLLQGSGSDLLWGGVWIFHLKRQKSR